MTDKRFDGAPSVTEKEEHLGAPQLEALQVLGDICGQYGPADFLHLIRRSTLFPHLQCSLGNWASGETRFAPLPVDWGGT